MLGSSAWFWRRAEQQWVSQKGSGLRNRGRLKLVKNCQRHLNGTQTSKHYKHRLSSLVPLICGWQQWQNISVALAEVKNSDFNTDQKGPAHRQHHRQCLQGPGTLLGSAHHKKRQSQGYYNVQGRATNTATSERHIQKSTARRPQN